MPDYTEGRRLLEEAATQLDSLSAERDMLRIRVEELEHEREALQARVKELEEKIQDWNEQTSNFAELANDAESRALRAEQERDALQLRHDKIATLVGGIVIELGCAADSAAVFEAIARLRHERDEAIAALKAEQSRGSYHCD